MDKILHLNKRRKIIISSVILTIGLLSTQLVDFNLRIKFIIGLGLITCVLSLWSLWEGINKTKALVLLILPVLFTMGVASYYFVLPIRWLTRLPVALLFALSFYLLLLGQNIFNVSAIRTIPLYRAASTANFLLTWITALLFYNVIDAFNLSFLWNGILVFLISLPLVLQNLWSVRMSDNLSADIYIQSAILSLLLGEFAIAFSFWPPVNTFITTFWALDLTVALFILNGLTLSFLRNRLNKEEVWLNIGLGVAILIATFLVTSWTG